VTGLVDTHCHLDFDRFDADRDEVIRRATEAGVTHIVVPGVDLPSSRRAVELAEQYEMIYAAVGVHPNDASGFDDETLNALRELLAHPKVVAVGEIGLDYYRDRTPPDFQHRIFRQQLHLAAETGKPVIIHSRESTADMLAILAEWQGGLNGLLAARPGVLHSFSATWQDAQVALELGFYLGFSGPITFEKADALRLVVANAPADKILVETDAPFLTPHPHRGQRNEPAYVRFVAEKLAQVRGETLEEVASRTSENAAALFGWRAL
jgi:TatD DNase family protein